MEEIWRDITGYEGIYQVSNLGRVKSLARIIKRGKIEQHRKQKILTPSLCRGGYLSAIISNEAISKRIKIHRLVAQAFIPNPDNKPQVNHINGVKTDNKMENLEWMTCKENIIHSIRNGMHYNKKIKQEIKCDVCGKIFFRQPNRLNRNCKNFCSRKCKGILMSMELKKKVICIERGKIFNSVKEAADFVGIHDSGISKCLKGKQTTAGGYTWRYAND